MQYFEWTDFEPYILNKAFILWKKQRELIQGPNTNFITPYVVLNLQPTRE